eukprot:12709561-Alexandrium_andersonii.AAC.1
MRLRSQQAPQSPVSIDSKPWTRTFCPVGPAGTAASSIWNVGPFSSLASVLFGYVVGVTSTRCSIW